MIKDNDRLNKPRFPRGGKLRLGTKDPERGFPVKLDHFLPDFDDKELEKEFLKLFADEDGHARSVQIQFATEDEEQVCPQYYMCYGKSGLLCKGDGDTANRLIGDETFEMEDVQCPGPGNCDYSFDRGSSGKPGCKQVMNLQYFIPKLPTMQVFQTDTSGTNSIINVNSGLALMRALYGKISMIPVTLSLRPMKTKTPDRKSVTVYTLCLDLGKGIEALQLEQSMASPLALPSPAPPADYVEPEPEPAVDPETGELTTLMNDSDVEAYVLKGVNGLALNDLCHYASEQDPPWSKKGILSILSFVDEGVPPNQFNEIIANAAPFLWSGNTVVETLEKALIEVQHTAPESAEPASDPEPNEPEQSIF